MAAFEPKLGEAETLEPAEVTPNLLWISGRSQLPRYGARSNPAVWVPGRALGRLQALQQEGLIRHHSGTIGR